MYSSKRGNKKALGKWGLGSKVAFSTGVDSFRVTSRYNGKKFIFDVYLKKVDSVVPKFGPNGLNGSQEITKAVYSEPDKDGNVKIIKPPYIAYWEPTDEKNGLEISIEVKKHNKREIFEAIESQLIYLSNVKVLFRAEGSINYEDKSLKTNILYKDDDVIVSQNKTFNKPHILLGTGDALINYGFVQFEELELESKTGPVGLIMDINDIEVTPSRENPIWSAKTRKAVLAKYEKVVKTVTAVVSDEIKGEKDYFSWLLKAAAVQSSISGLANTNMDNLDPDSDDYLIRVFSNIIDISGIQLEFVNSEFSVPYSTQIKNLIPNAFNLRLIKYQASDGFVKRESVKEFGSFDSSKIYITKTVANMYKDRYLNEQNGQFWLLSYDNNYKGKDTGDPRIQAILNSPLIKDYDATTIPDDVYAKYKTEAITDEEDVLQSQDYQDLRKKRAEEGQMLIHLWNGFTFSSKTYTIATLHDDLFSKEKVIYGSQSDRDLLINLASLKEFLEYKIAYVAKDVTKYIENRKNAIHVSELYLKRSNKNQLFLTDRIKEQILLSIIDANKKYYGFYRFRLFEYKDGKLWLKDKVHKSTYEFIQETYVKRYELKIDQKFQEALIGFVKAQFLGQDLSEHLKLINLSLPSAFSDKNQITEVDLVELDTFKEIVSDYERLSPIYNEFDSVLGYITESSLPKALEVVDLIYEGIVAKHGPFKPQPDETTDNTN